MASEELFPNVLDKISSPIIFVEEIENLLPELIINLENEDYNNNLLQILSSLFGAIFSEIGLENVDNQLLQSLLPCLQRKFIKCLGAICKAILKTNEETAINVTTVFDKSSQTCLDILAGYNGLMKNLMSYKNVKACEVNSLLRTLSVILLEVFTHCRDSEQIYGHYFTTVTETLTGLFRLGYETQTNFFKLLDNVLIFNCSFEDDICLLTGVLDGLSKVGEVVVSLDAKMMAEQWKGYTKLAHKYSKDLKQRLDVAAPVAFLSLTLHQSLNTVLDKQDATDEKTRNRHVKLGSLFMKIIVKICEEYEGYLGDCHAKLLELLITLSRTMAKPDTDVEASEIKRFIAVGSGPLLRHLITDQQFIQEFSNVCRDMASLTTEAKIGVLCLLLIVLKKLINADESTKQLWMNSHIFDNILNVLGACRFTIDENLTLDDADAYTCLVSRTAAFIVAADKPSYFVQVEKKMFKTLFGHNLYQIIFVQDLLCLLARLLSSEVCLKQVLYLVRILGGWEEGEKTRPEWVTSATTLGRLYPLLSPKSRAAVATNIKPGLKYLLGPLAFTNSQTPPTKILHKTAEDFSLFYTHRTLPAYTHLVNSLTGLAPCLAQLSDNEEALCVGKKTVLDLWELLRARPCLSRTEQSITGVTWWDQLFTLVALATQPILPLINNQELLTILEVSGRTVERRNSYCRLSVCRFLKKLGDYVVVPDSHSSRTNEALTRLYINLLGDEDSLLKQLATESFAHFAQFSTAEDVVKGVLRSDRRLQSHLNSYFKRTPQLSTDQSPHICPSYNEFVHKCSKRKWTEKAEEEVVLEGGLTPPTKKLKTSNEPEEVTRRIAEDLTLLASFQPDTLNTQQVSQLWQKLEEKFELVKIIMERL